jgi:hypothetical protein
LSRNFKVPLGASSAIQYVVPAVMPVGETATVFQPPRVGAPDVLPCASRAPGCDPLFPYKPTTSPVAVDVEST